ncbi:MAG: hypothetical protein IIX40_08665 [Alistipes sp.]|nr:hypothetical protein [Alistipes sp.]
MNYLIKILFVVTCILQATTICGQSILNQYDEQGNKHGQWIEDVGTNYKYIYNYHHGKKDGLHYVYLAGKLINAGKYNDDKLSFLSSFNKGVLMCDFYNFEHGNISIKHLQFIGKCKYRAYHSNGVISQQGIIYFDNGGPEMDTAYSPEIRYYDESGDLYKVEYYSIDYSLSEVCYYDKLGNITKKNR